MVAHSSILAWRIPRTEEPGGLQSMGLYRQEYWSGLPFPPPGDLPNPRVEPLSPVSAGGFLPLCHLGSPPAEMQILKKYVLEVLASAMVAILLRYISVSN